MNLAAILAVVLLAVVGVFQIALALGAPLGYAALGGGHEGVLPAGLRIASGVAGVVVYPLVGLFVLALAGLIKADWDARNRQGRYVGSGRPPMTRPVFQGTSSFEGCPSGVRETMENDAI